MKNRYWLVRAAVIALCVLAAGICYSCSMQKDKWSAESLWEPTERESLGQSARRLKEEASGESPLPTPLGPTSPVDEMDGAAAASDTSPAQEPLSTAQEKVSVYYVHICGEINSPGVYEMEEGSRIFQVVEEAGGFTEHAASQYLNMAQVVCDGMKIVVPDQSTIQSGNRFGLNEKGQGSALGSCIILPEGSGTERVTGLSNGSGGDNGSVKGKVNINTASKEELMTLKGIGEAKADDIIAYRDSHGGFRKIEDVMKISGIKNSAFEKIKNDITV